MILTKKYVRKNKKIENIKLSTFLIFFFRYISEVEDLYNKNKSIYGYQDVKLEIV